MTLNSSVVVRYHTFGASYNPKTHTVAWWLDGVNVITSATHVPAVAAQQKFYLILSCQSHRGVETGDDYLMLVKSVKAYGPPKLQ